MVKVREIPKELQQKAIEELNEDVARIPDDIKSIKDWLEDVKYINARTDDQHLLAFLRLSEFSLERTKERLDSFYTLRTMLPEYFSKRDPFLPEIQEILKLGAILPLPKPNDKTHPTVILVRSTALDPSTNQARTFLKTGMMFLDILLNEDDQTIICGGHLIDDVTGATIAHLISISTQLTKKTTKAFQDLFSAKLKGYHVLNVPSFVEMVIGIAKPFVSEEIQNKVHFHNTNDLDKLFNVVPKSIMPKEYGGEGPSLQELTDEWKAKVESYKDWFKEDEKYGTIEELRPKTSQDYFGWLESVAGFFEKLNVD